ncbi:MAG: bifunctional chorismate mutase/prephenate dehydrogenase [Leptolyngbyaceae cyanobacterium]
MSIQKQLESIDQALMQLLQERITLMQEHQQELHVAADGAAPTCAQPTYSHHSTYQELLHQHQIPSHLWDTLMTECAAAASTADPSRSSHQVQPRTVVIVGGNGVMGRFFGDRLTQAGHTVKVLGRNDWDHVDQIVADADLVILSVPLHQTEAIARRLAPHLSPHTGLTDIASVKAPILQTMLEVHRGPVLGLHPMFGPGVNSFLAQKVVVCPGRQDEAFDWLLEAIAQDGGHLVTSSAEEHDQIMIIVQAIRHFATLCLGIFLAREDIDINRSLEFASPLFRMELNIIGRMFAQDPALCSEIITASGDRRQAIQRLAHTCQELADLFLNGNQDVLLEEFEQAHQLFHHESARALKESNYLINSLMSMIAANTVVIQPDSSQHTYA